MGNWDIVMPYDTRATEFLTKEGLPHPLALEGNRAPTVRELTSIDEIVAHLRIRATTLEAELRAVYAIVQLCGQQWIYPDSGLPSIVIDPSIDFRSALDAWKEAMERGDWEWTYRELYGSHRG